MHIYIFGYIHVDLGVAIKTYFERRIEKFNAKVCLLIYRKNSTEVLFFYEHICIFSLKIPSLVLNICMWLLLLEETMKNVTLK